MALDSIHQKFLDACKKVIVEKGKCSYPLSIYGGALRDEVAGLSQYNDIDIVVGDSNNILIPKYLADYIADEAKFFGLKVKNIDSFRVDLANAKWQKCTYAEGDRFSKIRANFALEDENGKTASINVEFIKANYAEEKTHVNYGHDLDADVNSLYFDHSGLHSSISEKGSIPEGLLSRIKAGEYAKTNYCKSARANKLKIWNERVKSNIDFKTEVKIEKKEEEKTMATNSKKTIVARNLESMNEAAFLMAAMKTQDLSQKGMLEIVKHMGLDENERRGIEKLMGNEFFACLLGLGIGNAIEYIPGAEDKPQVGKLAGKMREFAFAKAGVTAIDGLFEKFAPNVMGILGQMNQVVESLPQVKTESLPEVSAKIRVADSNDDVDVDFEEEENVKSNVSSLRVANRRNRLG